MSLTSLSDPQITAIQAAASPEEAAQRFVQIVTRELGQIVADALDTTLPAIQKNLAGNSAIAGWQNHIGGCAIGLDWERVRPTLPACTFISSVERSTPTLSAMNVEVVGSISIRGTF